MPWNNRQVRFFFTEVTANLLKEPTASDSNEMKINDDLAPLRLPPLLGAKRFPKLQKDDKRNCLEYSLLERLPLHDDKSAIDSVAGIIDTYNGQEDLLYQMISEAGVQSVFSDATANDETARTTCGRNPTALNINDSIEIGHSLGGSRRTVSDGSLVFPVGVRNY